MLKEEKSCLPNLALRTAREEMGWSQQQVARLVGTNAFTVCRWERGQAFPSPHYRQELCRIFGKRTGELGLITPTGTKKKDSPVPQREIPLTEEDISTLTSTLLPLHHDMLVGRQPILAQIKMYLVQGKTSILCGLPGIGKTTIAVELANSQEMQTRFPDGILWARLRDTPNILALLQSWAQILGLSASEIASLENVSKLRQALKRVVGERKILFILDDVRDIDSLLALSIGGAACSYLVTTHFLTLAVQFAQEGVLIVPELDLMDGLELLAQHSPAVVKQHYKQAQELVAAVGGHPLALTLMGRYIYIQAFSGHPRRIQAALARLQQADHRLQVTELVFLPDRMAKLSYSLQGALAQSVSMLSKTAQVVLRSLATFPPKPDTFTEKDAQTVCHIEKEDLIKQLDALIDAGLLENDTSGRYTLHPVLRDYARFCIADDASYP